MENLRKKILMAVLGNNEVINIFSTLTIKKMAVDLDKDHPQTNQLLDFFTTTDVKLLWEEKLALEIFDKYPFLQDKNFVKERYFLFDRTLNDYYKFVVDTEIGSARKFIIRLREYRLAEKNKFSKTPSCCIREAEIKLLEAEKELFTDLEKGKIKRWQLYTVFVLFLLFIDYVGDVERLKKIFVAKQEEILAASKYQ